MPCHHLKERKTAGGQLVRRVAGRLGKPPLGVLNLLSSPAPPPSHAPVALYQQLAAKKLSRFREYAALFPEACFVLIGDNGQVGPGLARPCTARQLRMVVGVGCCMAWALGTRAADQQCSSPWRLHVLPLPHAHSSFSPCCPAFTGRCAVCRDPVVLHAPEPAARRALPPAVLPHAQGGAHRWGAGAGRGPLLGWHAVGMC